MRFVILILLFSFHQPAGAASKEKCSPERERKQNSFAGEVYHLSDGDTIEVLTKMGGIRKVRLLFMDTPETKFFGKSQGEAGEVAYERLKELLPKGTEVLVRYETTPCDIYGRFLGVVWKGQEEINLKMVEEGFAASVCFAPDLANCERYAEAAKKNLKYGPNVFRDYKALLPHEFRFQESGRPEAPFVGNLRTKEVFPFERFEEIPGLDRVFFFTLEHITPPYHLSL